MAGRQKLADKGLLNCFVSGRVETPAVDYGSSGCLKYHSLPRSNQHQLNLCPKKGGRLPPLRAIIFDAAIAATASYPPKVSKDLLEARKIIYDWPKFDDAGLERVGVHHRSLQANQRKIRAEKVF